MFGSDFFGNFGLPPFPFQGMDPQGGLLGSNIETPADPSGATGTAPGPSGPALHLSSPDAPAGPPMGGAAAGAAPPTGGVVTSPLSSGALSPGAVPPQPTEPAAAPAAGVGSQFGGPNV